MEKLTSSENPEDHMKLVEGAIDSAIKAGAGAGPAAGGGAAAENPFVNEGATAAVGGPALSIFVTASREMEGGKKSPQGRRNSLFVESGGSSGSRAHEPVPLVPLSYSEKKSALARGRKAAARKPGTSTSGGNIFERTQIAGQSLTGTVSTGGAAVPIRGGLSLSKSTIASLSKGALMSLGVGRDLLDDRDNTKRAIDNRYDSDDRLAADLLKGDDRAEQLVNSGKQNHRVDQLAKSRPRVFQGKGSNASTAAKGPAPPNSH